VVQTPRGERYTRNGAFQINAQGELVTNTGDRVVGDGGPIQFQSTDNSISINPDGTITAREGGNSRNDSARGKLRLVRFDSVQQLQKDGTTMFNAPAGVAPQEAGTSSRVKQGSLEQSNVHSVVEMARMIEVTRTYTQVTAMMQQFSDLRRSAVEKLAEVPA
jgi:flagellar basal body rod protein FlgG